MPVNDGSDPGGVLFGVRWENVGGTRLVTLTGEIDLAAREHLQQALDWPNLIVDTSDVTFIDAIGIECLMRARSDSKFLIVGERNRPVARLFELTGITQLFPEP